MTYCEFGRLLSFHPVPASKERGVALGDGNFQIRSAQVTAEETSFQGTDNLRTITGSARYMKPTEPFESDVKDWFMKACSWHDLHGV